MNSHTIIAMYQALTDTGQRMLAAAISQDWNGFIELAGQMNDLTAALQANDVNIALDADELAQKRDLIERYLASDRDIRAAVAPRMAVLATIVNATGTANTIHNLYGSTP